MSPKPSRNEVKKSWQKHANSREEMISGNFGKLFIPQSSKKWGFRIFLFFCFGSHMALGSPLGNGTLKNFLAP